jgi:hypothetical protein
MKSYVSIPRKFGKTNVLRLRSTPYMKHSKFQRMVMHSLLRNRSKGHQFVRTTDIISWRTRITDGSWDWKVYQC